MECPHCHETFNHITSNVENPWAIQPVVPVLCQSCASISMADQYGIRFPTQKEMMMLYESEIWKTQIQPAQKYCLRVIRARTAHLN